MKKKIIFAALLAVLVGMFGSQQRSSVQTTLTIGEMKIAVEIADTETERARGLSGREALAENSGMLFVFDTTDYHNFWMKEMNFPLDIIWLDDNWRVIDITANISPKDFPTTYQPRLPARYVLEVNSGFTTNHQITIGTQTVSK